MGVLFARHCFPLTVHGGQADGPGLGPPSLPRHGELIFAIFLVTHPHIARNSHTCTLPN